MGSFDVFAPKTAEDSMRFTRAVLNDLQALQVMLAENMIESDIQRIGAEQELFLVNERWRPAPVASQILEILADEQFTTELAEFNLEINLDPLKFEGRCLSLMDKTLKIALDKLTDAAATIGVTPILTGILPTIRHEHLDPSYMAPVARYAALFKRLEELRGGTFDYHIRGVDELYVSQVHPSLEFCNASFQVHYQTPPDRFVDAYNFSKLISGPVLAAAVNSPLLLGRRLWQETRIAVFQQAIDTRGWHLQREKQARVFFAKNWVKNSILDIFQDDLARFQVLLCTRNPQDAMATLEKGEIPRLSALSIFSGTVYRWNRACYGITDGKPHLRIENRLLPSGPTIADEVANAAFWLGLMHGMPDSCRDLPGKFSFDKVVYNFTKAARNGLQTRMQWLDGREIDAPTLILEELLPIAASGLKNAGIDPKDSERFLGIISDRVESGITGSAWMSRHYSRLRKIGATDAVCMALTASMSKRQQEGDPVHTWRAPDISEAGGWDIRFQRVEQIMSEDLYCLNADDPVELAAWIMQWKNIHHLPVESNDNRIIGLVTSRMLLRLILGDQFQSGGMQRVKEIMETDPVVVAPETPTHAAIQAMKGKGRELGCLLVAREGRLAGILTQSDLVKVAGVVLGAQAEDGGSNGQPEERDKI